MKHKKNKQSGFTLIELLVAISIFAIFIVIAASSLVNVLKLEQKANILRQTQTDARYILETISREARSANGELNSKKERVASAYSFDNPTNPTILTITSTNFSSGLVTQKQYSKSGSTTDGYVVRVTTSTKNIDGTSYTTDPALASVPMNVLSDLKVINLDFTGSVVNTDLSIPPLLVMHLTAESGRGRNFVGDEYRAYVDLETDVSPRNY